MVRALTSVGSHHIFTDTDYRRPRGLFHALHHVDGLLMEFILTPRSAAVVTHRLVRMASPRVFPVAATVPTGLERGAVEECREVLGREATAHRGSITCTLEAVEELAKV